jgi:hypothetical protein
VLFVVPTFNFVARREEFVEEKSPGLTHPGPAQPVDARRTKGSELDHRSHVFQASRGALALGLFVRHVRRRNEPRKRGVGYVKRRGASIRPKKESGG